MWIAIEVASTLGCSAKLSARQCDDLLILRAKADDYAHRNSQLFVELEQVKKVANDKAQLAAQLKAIVLQIHHGTYDAYWSEGDRVAALSAVFDSYPMLAECLKEHSDGESACVVSLPEVVQLQKERDGYAEVCASFDQLVETLCEASNFGRKDEFDAALSALADFSDNWHLGRDL